MKDSLRVVAIVPARGGYDKVPYLNIKKLGSLPLVAHTLLEAKNSRYIDRVIVSTDDAQVAEVAREYEAEVIERPVELAGPSILIKEVVTHAVHCLESQGDTSDVVVTLQATSPFRTAEQIDEALDKLVEEGFDSVISLVEERALTWHVVGGKLEPLFDKPGRREDMKPFYREDGAIWAMKRPVLDVTARLGQKIGYLLMDKTSALTVHDISDFWLAEKLVRLRRILFRVDGGGKIGMGHVYRSLAVADELRAVSTADILFLMSAEYPEGRRRVSDSGFPVRVLQKAATESVIEAIREYSPDIVVNDRPLLEKDYLSALATVGASTVNLVDNLENLEDPVEAASVIIATMHEDQVDSEGYYAGPAYAILHESFAGQTKSIRERPRGLVLTFGGSDPQNLTLRVLRALAPLASGLEVTAILGPAFSYKKELETSLDQLSYRPRILEGVDHMAKVLREADLVFCSGGMTVYEIAALGTPGIVLCQNVREMRRMEKFARRGSVLHLGLGSGVAEERIREAARELLSNPDKRRRMSEAGRRLVDSYGARRVVDLVMNSVPARSGRGGSSS